MVEREEFPYHCISKEDADRYCKRGATRYVTPHLPQPSPMSIASFKSFFLGGFSNVDRLSSFYCLVCAASSGLGCLAQLGRGNRRWLMPLYPAARFAGQRLSGMSCPRRRTVGLARPLWSLPRPDRRTRWQARRCPRWSVTLTATPKRPETHTRPARPSVAGTTAARVGPHSRRTVRSPA